MSTLDDMFLSYYIQLEILFYNSRRQFSLIPIVVNASREIYDQQTLLGFKFVAFKTLLP